MRGCSTHQNKKKSLINMHTLWVLYTCSWWLKTKVTNIVRGGSTYHNMEKNTITHGSGNAYFLWSVALHLFIGDVQHDGHSWHLLYEVLNVTSAHSNPSLCPSTTIVTIQYLFPRCLPCLSRRWTHNQTSSANRDKCTYLRKYAFPEPYFETFFLILVGTTISENIRYFLTTYIYIYIYSHKDPFAYFTALPRCSDQKICMKCYFILRKLHRARKIFFKIILHNCKINLLM